MISIRVNALDGASPTLRAIVSALSGSEAAELNEVGGRYAVNYAARYHREFDRSGGWRGKRYLGAGTGEGSSFGAEVASGWQFRSASPGEAVIGNDASHYAFKVRGGTITPKRAGALTIPLIAEARGLRASVYVQNTGRKLFISKNRNALLERIEGAITGSRGRRGQAGSTVIRTGSVRAVYALVKSVTQAPWPGALPPEDELGTAFAEGWREALAQMIEEAES